MPNDQNDPPMTFEKMIESGGLIGALDGLPAYEEMRNPAYDGPMGIFTDYDGDKPSHP